MSTLTTGAAVRLVRLRRKKSQAEMARDLGVTTQYVSMVETGRKEPGRSFVERVRAWSGYDPRLLVLLSEVGAKQADICSLASHRHLLRGTRT